MAQGPHVPTAREHALGIFFVLLVAVIWVVSGELIQLIFDDFPVGPYFLTYYCVSLFTVCLLGFVQPSWRSTLKHPEPATLDYTRLTDLADAEPLTGAQQQHPYQPVTFSAAYVFRVAAILAPIFFLSNWAFNVGLHLTTVASSSTISTLTTLFTLVLGAMSGVERFSLSKLFATLLSTAGVAMISSSDNGTGKEGSLKGDLLSVLAAFIYALYTTILKKKSGRDGDMSMSMMFGFMGFVVAVTLWPGLLFVHAIGWEHIPKLSPRALAFLTLNGLIGTVLSDYLWAKSVVLTTPLIGTLSLSMTVPMAFLIDFLLHKKVSFEPIYVAGAALVLLGFVIINFDEFANRRNVEAAERREINDAFVEDMSALRDEEESVS